MKTNALKKQFPIFATYPNLTFLDNASTTQKPQVVVDALVDFYTKYNANVHRGLYPLSEKATELYESARQKVAKFINAEPEEIIFTSGTTSGVNGIAQSLYSTQMINQSPRILVSEGEHHSNLLPWQQLPNAKLYYLEKLEIHSSEYTISPGKSYDVIALNLISNVTGKFNDVRKLRNEAPGGFMLLDMAQAVGHIPINVKELGADFVVFSGHKMYGPMGVGVIWGKKEFLQKMNPFNFGGGMIREVKRDSSTWSEVPSKFEAGTPSVADVYALGVAIDFINEVGFVRIQLEEANLRSYLLEKLKEVPGLEIYHPDLSEPAGGVISISSDKAHPHDLAQYLGERDISVRAGHHCTQILHREVLKIPASLRISLGIYNDESDIDIFIDNLLNGLKIYEKKISN